MEQRSLTVTYTPLESGDAESRWLRIEQEKPEEDETISVAEAAAIIDSLYNIEPCDDGMGGGGEETDEDKEPEEDVVEEALAEMLRRAGVCHEEEYWTAVIRVYRSHKWPETYEIRSETATVESTEPVRESYRQDVEVSGAVIELDMPYDGGLTGIPAGVQWEVRGSTVNLDRPVNGHLRLRYDTRYERVTLRVPTDSGDTDPQAAIGVVGGGDAKRQRPELPSAAVAVFWGDLAASCELEPPEQDDEISPEELARICDPKHGGGAILQPGSGCWQTIEHYWRCSCSRRKVNAWEEEVEVDCGGEDPGTYLGRFEAFGGYTWCDGEEDELSDPEYFERRCCRPPHAPLPRCRKSYAVYSGGHGIENGAAYWKNIYGQDVGMIAVLPQEGKCGDLVTEWNVPRKNCCDDAEPLTPDPQNPTTIHAPGSVLLEVDGGAPDTDKNPHPRRWRASAGYYFDPDLSVNYRPDGGGMQWVYAAPDACNNAVIQVDDGCSSVTMRLTRDNPSDAMVLSPDEATVSPGATVVVGAYNAQGEVYWSAGALRLLTPQGQTTAVFEAPDNFCGSDRVVATDACMNMAFMTVLSTRGKWVEQKNFDPCNPPWVGAQTGNFISGLGIEVLVGNIRAICDREQRSYGYLYDSWPGCSSAWNNSSQTPDPRNPCDYNGLEMFTRGDGGSWNNDDRDGFTWCGTQNYVCDNRMCRHQPPSSPGVGYSAYVMAQWIERLWKWECEE